MACGSGCCGPPKVHVPPASNAPPLIAPADGCCVGDKDRKESLDDHRDAESKEEDCAEGCCGSVAKVESIKPDQDYQKGCCDSGPKSDSGSEADCGATVPGNKPEETESGCQKGCCGSSKNTEPTGAGISKAAPATDSCCAPKPQLDDGCDKGCCDSMKDTKTAPSQEKTSDIVQSCSSATPETAKDDKKGCCGDKSDKKDGDCCAHKPAIDDGCKQGCCGSVEDAQTTIPSDAEDDCCKPKTDVKDDCKKGCCGSSETKPVDSCGSNATAKKPKAKDDCNKGCCSSATSVKPQMDKAPSCCEGKTSPCCDSTCIDRLALRECTSKKPAGSRSSEKTSGDDECTGGHDGKPCRGHARTVRETYQAKLEALGCICRALLALGQESCCAPRERSSVERKRSSLKSSRSRTSTDSCCPPGASKTVCASSTKSRPKTKKGPGRASFESKAGGCADGCCAKPKAPSIKDSCADACCAKPKAPSIAGSCADSCCGDEGPPPVFEPSGKADVNVTDLERGVSGREHVILSISGMTCTGCETKLKRTLATVDAIKNLKTSLVLARAEFDLDLGAGTVADVMKHLERTTEFKCEKITSQGASIDLVVPGDAEGFISQPWPEGVTDIRAVDKKTVHVEFDAEVVGARDLVEKGWGSPMQLAPPRMDPTLEAGSKHVRNVGWMTLLSIVLTIPVLVMSWAPLPENEIAYGSASLALATIVQVAIAGPFYPKALKSLIFSRMIEMDLLIVLSTSAAYIFSVVSFGYLVSHKPLSTGEFFETSTLLVTLIMVGRYVSALARQKAVESISIRSLQTSNATIVNKSGQEKEIDSRLLQYGDVFKVAPDSRIPTDGTVISGSSELDESMITGESRVIEKCPGSPVIAGSINGSGTLSVRLTRLPRDNTISNIAGMVDEAKLSKPKIQDLADRVASYFVPVVVTLTIITFAVWIAVGVAVRKQSGSEATIRAVTYAITVLIVSCPCAIGLAVPMVIVIASGVAAERGVIFKSADSIEVAYKTSHVVFDKTGTLTEGKLSIAEECYLTDDPDSIRPMLLGLVGSIKHPVSAAVAAHLRQTGTSPAAVSDPKTFTGKGVEGTLSGRLLRAGNSIWLGVSSDSKVSSVLSKGQTAFCFMVDGTLAAVFGLEDSVRPDAASTVSKLQASGISVHVLSGDDDGAVRRVAAQLGIPEANIRSRCNPGDKQEYIQSLLATPVARAGPRRKPGKPVVVFCGDGTNDAVALAQATIGVHMNEGTDVAKSAADVVLMRPSLAGVLTAISISRKAVHRIAFNFGWSFVYNLFAILLGSGAFVNARIPPEFAGLGELASVLPVIVAAVLLRWSNV
ncbi:P-type cation-transporting ATPase 2 [Colletotrichum sojae]|uniref:P-type cation-transporting ATPase 2 n=1 Tax=Colletotrichum sojae TaxID=2175907 RepID=A0A8H6J8B0_9PEZI|nr:P-type cation-transporting ATPase 2 [Colletotrichum sojae]